MALADDIEALTTQTLSALEATRCGWTLPFDGFPRKQTSPTATRLSRVS
jgi:hypothetical protein